MTKAQFKSKFNCVAGPEYSGAEYPPFDERAINECSSRFIAILDSIERRD